MAEKEKFIDIVIAMRKAQKAYFSYHRESDLIKARQLEAKVDKALAIYQGAPRQTGLF